MSYPIYVMTRCLAFTILIETIVAISIGIRNIKDIIYIILANIVTNPMVVSIPLLTAALYNQKVSRVTTIILEIITLVIEGYVYKKSLSNKNMNPYVLSFILNVMSFVIGLFIVK